MRRTELDQRNTAIQMTLLRGPVAPIANVDEESLILTGSQRRWASARNVGYYSGLTLAYLSNTVYTFLVSCMFAAFSYRRAKGDISLGTFYATSSFAMNAPMAWFFSERTIDTFKRLFKKHEPAFIACFLVSFVLAAGTTAAGLKVASESVEGLKEIKALAPFITPGFGYFLTALSAFNTFSTRFIGSVYLLFSVWQGVKSLYRQFSNTYRPYYQLQDDLYRHGSKVNVAFVPTDDKSDKENLEQYVRNFYAELQRQGIKPGESARSRLIKYAMAAVTVTFVATMIVNLMPLWIKLTVGGAKSFSDSLSKSIPFVVYAATSNELFYLNSALQFLPSAKTFAVRGYVNAKEKLQGSSVWMIGGAILLSVAVVATWGTLAYFSGTGYGEDGLEAMQEGFKEMADTIWMSWMGWWTNLFMPVYSSIITTASAGFLVNGGAALRFALDRFSFFHEKKDAPMTFGIQAAKSTLDQAIEKGETEIGLRDTIERLRTAASPHVSFWQSCSSKVRELRHGDEGLPFASRGTGKSYST